MSKQIHGGQTLTTGGTLAAGETLVGLAGNPGALIIAEGRTANDGSIILDGSSKPRVSGATLREIGVLTNAGNISVGGATNSTHAALLDVVRTLNNTGAIYAAAGAYSAVNGLGAGGEVLIDATGTLNNSGMLTLQSGTRLYSTGATLIDNGMLTNAAGGTIDINAEDRTYSAYPAATLLITGVLQNSGMLTVGSADTNYYSLSNQGGNALLIDSGSLINSGVIMVDSNGATLGSGSGGYSTLEILGALVNQGEIVLENGASGGHYYYTGYGALLLDSGSLDNSGTILLAGYFPSAGTGGSMVASGVLTNSGMIVVDEDAAITVSGTATNTGGIVLHGGASSGYSGIAAYYPGIGGVLSVTGVMANSGTISLGGGLATAYENGYGGYGGYGSELAIAGTMQNYGVLAVGGGNGSDPLYPRSADSIAGRGATISLLGSLFNSGTIDLQQASVSSYGLYGTGAVLIDNGDLRNAGLITIDGGPGSAAGTLTIGASGTLFAEGGTISGTGVLVNQGLISSVFGTTIAGVTFTNDGTVQALDGTTNISNAVAADAGRTGLFSLMEGATLDLGGAIAASQMVGFYAGSPDTLALGDAKGFGGTLSGLGAGDLIDFLKLDVTSATTSGDTLAIGLSSGTTLDLALAAPLVGVSLNLQRDGMHGTDLVLAASGQAHF